MTRRFRPTRLSVSRTAIVGFWALFSAWFIFAEGLPYGRWNTPAGYATVIADGLMHRDSWMRIVSGERTIGYSNSRIDIDEFTPGGQYLLTNDTVADLPLFGSEHRTAIRSRIILDADRQLVEFHFDLHSAASVIRLQGRHIGNQMFEIVVQGPLALAPMRVTLPRNAMIFPPTAEIGLGRLRPGRKITLQVFDPFTLRSVPMSVEALRRETIPHRGHSRSVTVLAMHYQGMILHSWVDDDGILLRQETPLGWILEQCDPADALGFMEPRTAVRETAHEKQATTTP